MNLPFAVLGIKPGLLAKNVPIKLSTNEILDDPVPDQKRLTLREIVENWTAPEEPAILSTIQIPNPRFVESYAQTPSKNRIIQPTPPKSERKEKSSRICC
jgi:hypothetical protein